MGEETNLPPEEFQIIYVATLPSKRWTITPHTLLLLSHFSHVQLCATPQTLKCGLYLVACFRGTQDGKQSQGNFTVEQCDSHHLDQAVKVDVIVITRVNNTVCP